MVMSESCVEFQNPVCVLATQTWIGSYLPSFSVYFGPPIVIHSPFMSTAITCACTPEGIIVAADGRRKKISTKSASEKPADKTRKLFCFSATSPPFVCAYAAAGSVEILDDNTGIVVFSFQKEIEHALNATTQDGHSFSAPEDFLKNVVSKVCKRLAGAKDSETIGAYPSGSTDDPNLITSIVFTGFYHDDPFLTLFQLRHTDQIIADPVLACLKRGIGANPSGWFEIVSGSPVVYERLFRTNKPDLKRYRTPSIKNQDICKRKFPATLKEAAKLSANYIQACIDNRNLDREKCDFIGGHIHSAKITRESGFEWIVPPRPHRGTM